MVTHEDEVSQHAKRMIRLKDGEIQIDQKIQDRKTFPAETIEKISMDADSSSQVDSA